MEKTASNTTAQATQSTKSTQSTQNTSQQFDAATIQAFKAADTDNSGSVDKVEANAKGITDCAFKRADKDGDGQLSMEEFAETMKKQDAAQAKGPCSGGGGSCGGKGAAKDANCPKVDSVAENNTEEELRKKLEAMGYSDAQIEQILAAAKSNPKLAQAIMSGDKAAVDTEMKNMSSIADTDPKKAKTAGNDNMSSSQYAPPVDPSSSTNGPRRNGTQVA